ncbi:MAG TPA: YrdB family protein [Ktedonobacteraceae bacterium]
MLSLLKNLNLALAFLLELGVLAALCYFGFTIQPNPPLKISLGIGLPVVAIVIWALFGAPRSKRRLQGLPFLLLQIVFFGCAAVVLYIVGQHLLGIIFALVFVLNTVLAYVWGQKEQE